MVLLFIAGSCAGQIALALSLTVTLLTKIVALHGFLVVVPASTGSSGRPETRSLLTHGCCKLSKGLLFLLLFLLGLLLLQLGTQLHGLSGLAIGYVQGLGQLGKLLVDVDLRKSRGRDSR